MEGHTYEDELAEATRRGLWSAALYGGQASVKGTTMSFTEWIALNDGNVKDFGRWIGLQEVGHPLPACRVSRAEVEFIQNHFKSE
jgi:hypothetical protein